MPDGFMEPFRRALGMAAERRLGQAAGDERWVGYFCTYSPVEIIHAAGFTPVRIVGAGDKVDLADALTPSFICPYLRKALNEGLAGEYGFLSGVVQGYTCDAACGLINIWRENIGGDMFHTVPLPYNDNRDSRTYLRAAYRELIEKLEASGGRVTNDSLAGSVGLYAEIRALGLELYRLRYERRLPLSAGDVLTVVLAGQVAPPEEYRGMLESLLAEVRDAGPRETEGRPVLVSGSLVEDPVVLDILEESGGRVAGDDLCTGLRGFMPPDGAGADPMERLIDRHFNRWPCPARSRAAVRGPLLADLARRAGAEGVVFIFQKFCTPHLADHPVVRDALREAGIPSLLIELEETGVNEGQIRTRFEGFFQMMEQ